MRIRNLLFGMLASAIACLALASAAGATVPRAFVSTQGLDTNPCSAAEPCRSFNQALTVVQPSGEIVVQDSGGYSTGFTITQSVTIDGGGFNASVLSTSRTDLCTINAGASDRVVLRGICFHGANLGNNAINVMQGGSLYIEHCSISEFTGDGVRMVNGGNLFVTGNDVRKCAVGLLVFAGGEAANLVAQDSRFTECSNAGVLIGVVGAGSVTGSLSNCSASLCNKGFAVFSDTAANADLTLVNCRAVNNNASGLSATSTSTGNATMRIANCVAAGNTTGIDTSSSGGGTASVIGTGPGTNFISGNGTDGAVGGSVTLQ
jgi:hypothetical protein